MHWQYRTICRGPNSILQNLYDVIGPKAHDYISFYGLRAHGRLCEGGPLVTNQVKYESCPFLEHVLFSARVLALCHLRVVIQRISM